MPRLPCCWVFLLLALGACRDDTTRRKIVPPEEPPPSCGDGKIDAPEECDGSDLAGATCQSLGFDTGGLSCDGSCKFNTVACIKRCGNGVKELGEECDGILGVSECANWGYKNCSTSCRIESAHCVSVPYISSPALLLAQGGVATITDLTPRGLGDVVVAVPSYLRLETFPYTVEQGLVAGRKLSFDQAAVLPIAGDLDGDGENDLAAINGDGSVGRYVYQKGTNTFRHEALRADAGAACPATRWIGAGTLDADDSRDLAALACPGSGPSLWDAIHVYRGGAAANPPEVIATTGLKAAAMGDHNSDGLDDLLYVVSGASELRVLLSTPPGFTEASALPLPYELPSFAAADADADGDLDLAVTEPSAVKILENTGVGFAERQSFALATQSPPVFIDLDLDGRPEVAWLDGAHVRVLRNAGGFLFTAHEFPTGVGTPMALAAGDLDGDQDPDLAASYSTGGTATATYVLINKVR